MLEISWYLCSLKFHSQNRKDLHCFLAIQDGTKPKVALNEPLKRNYTKNYQTKLQFHPGTWLPAPVQQASLTFYSKVPRVQITYDDDDPMIHTCLHLNANWFKHVFQPASIFLPICPLWQFPKTHPKKHAHKDTIFLLFQDQTMSVSAALPHLRQALLQRRHRVARTPRQLHHVTGGLAQAQHVVSHGVVRGERFGLRLQASFAWWSGWCEFILIFFWGGRGTFEWFVLRHGKPCLRF